MLYCTRESLFLQYLLNLTLLFCLYMEDLLLANVGGLLWTCSSLRAMITGWPHLSLIALHGCSFHVHDRHTRSDESSDARAAEFPPGPPQRCMSPDASTSIFIAMS